MDLRDVLSTFNTLQNNNLGMTGTSVVHESNSDLSSKAHSFAEKILQGKIDSSALGLTQMQAHKLAHNIREGKIDLASLADRFPQIFNSTKENKINEDWGSSDWYPVMKLMKERVGDDIFNEAKIWEAAIECAEIWGDMMGYPSNEEAARRIIRMYHMRSGNKMTESENSSSQFNNMKDMDSVLQTHGYKHHKATNNGVVYRNKNRAIKIIPAGTKDYDKTHHTWKSLDGSTGTGHQTLSDHLKALKMRGVHESLKPTTFCPRCSSGNVYATGSGNLDYKSKSRQDTNHCKDCGHQFANNYNNDLGLPELQEDSEQSPTSPRQATENVVRAMNWKCSSKTTGGSRWSNSGSSLDSTQVIISADGSWKVFINGKKKGTGTNAESLQNGFGKKKSVDEASHPDIPESDDYCDACETEVANHECGHGILCDKCYADIHGSLDNECDLNEDSTATDYNPTLNQQENLSEVEHTSEPQVTELSFANFFDKQNGRAQFGLVITGAGAPLQEWVDGIAEMLVKQQIVDSQPVFKSAFKLLGNVAGENGRTDLVLLFADPKKINVGKLAMWRLQFGDASWVDDFYDNRQSDYGIDHDLDDDNEDIEEDGQNIEMNHGGKIKGAFGFDESKIVECEGQSMANTKDPYTDSVNITDVYDSVSDSKTITITAKGQKAEELKDILRLSGMVPQSISHKPGQMSAISDPKRNDNMYEELKHTGDCSSCNGSGKDKDGKDCKECLGMGLNFEKKKDDKKKVKEEWQNEPNEQTLSAHVQLIDMADGLAKPVKMINKFNKGDNAMTIKRDKETKEGVDESVNALANKLKNKYRASLAEDKKEVTEWKKTKKGEIALDYKDHADSKVVDAVKKKNKLDKKKKKVNESGHDPDNCHLCGRPGCSGEMGDCSYWDEDDNNDTLDEADFDFLDNDFTEDPELSDDHTIGYSNIHGDQKYKKHNEINWPKEMNDTQLSGLDSHGEFDSEDADEHFDDFDGELDEDTTFGDRPNMLFPGDKVYIDPNYGGGTGVVKEGIGTFYWVNTKKGVQSFHGSNLSKKPWGSNDSMIHDDDEDELDESEYSNGECDDCGAAHDDDHETYCPKYGQKGESWESGDYVRDTNDGEKGEIFKVRGYPDDRRVWIGDAQGRGWYISPSRLKKVDEEDPDVKKHFSHEDESDEEVDY